MIAQSTDYMQHKNFVPVAKPIDVWNVTLAPAQRDAVKARLAERWPEVADCQVVNVNRRFRLLPVRGATIPEDCTPKDVLDAILTVQSQVDATMAVLQPDKVR